jgi:hypothetical protein
VQVPAKDGANDKASDENRIHRFPAACAGCAASRARAQQLQPAADTKVAPASVAQPLSLGDAGRKAREQRKSAPHATKVYTNDDLPRNSSISIIGAQPAPPPAEPTASPDTRAADAAGVTLETPAGTKKAARHDEADWRERFEKLRAKVIQAEDEEAAL